MQTQANKTYTITLWKRMCEKLFGHEWCNWGGRVKMVPIERYRTQYIYLLHCASCAITTPHLNASVPAGTAKPPSGYWV